MTQPTRSELEPFGQQAFAMRYVGQRPAAADGFMWPVYGIIFMDDLRPRGARTEE